MKFPSEALIYHLTNRYLLKFLPFEVIIELQDNFDAAEREIKENKETLAWSQRVFWLSHWDGVLSTTEEMEHIAMILSSALLRSKQVNIQCVDKDQSIAFNVFSLIKRDDSFFVIGSCDKSNDPIVISVRKILAIELTGNPAIQPIPEFDLHLFLETKLNFSYGAEKLDCLQLEFADELYSYVCDHKIVADKISIIPPKEYHHSGYFAMKAQGVADGDRLRQWIRGFGMLAQVLKPDALRLEMEQARLDTRTNLLSATEFKRCLNREIHRCLRSCQKTFALLVLDLDHFKLVNDLNGHDFGDTVLLRVAECLRHYDDAARYGGEEFCILLPDIDSSEAFTIADRIRRQIEQQKFINKTGKNVPVTTSIGLAIYPLRILINLNSDSGRT